MTYHTHQLNFQNHSHVIARQDSITGDSIKTDDEVVFCSICQSVFLKESWEYMKNTHCNQNETLDFVPTQQQMQAKENASLFKVSISNRDFQQSIIILGVVVGMAVLVVPLLFSSADETWKKATILFTTATILFGLLLLVYQEKKNLIKNSVFIKIVGKEIVLHSEVYKDEPILRIEYKSENTSVGRVLRMVKLLRVYSDKEKYNEYFLDLEIQYPYNINFLRNLMQVSEFAPITFYTEDKKEYQFLDEKKEEYEGNIILTKKMPFY